MRTAERMPEMERPEPKEGNIVVRKRIRLLAIGTLLFALAVAGCTRGRSITLSDAGTLNEQGTEIRCAPPLTRSHLHASVEIEILDEWTPPLPGMPMKFADGRSATVTVVLLTKDGMRYEPKLFGWSTGNILDARFEDLVPKGAQIETVTIRSTTPVKHGRIVWRDYTPL